MRTFTAKAGFVIIGALIVVALLAPLLAPYDPSEYELPLAFAGPSLAHPLGNDAFGRDLLSRVIYGTRISFGIGIAVVGLSLAVGSIIGLCAGYAGGIVDRAFVFVSDVFLAFPSFLFAIAVAAFLRPSVENVILILCLKGWVTYARLTRGQALALKEREFITAGRAIGLPIPRLLFRHLLPNMMGPLLINASFGLAGVILIESSLSFLGLGVPPDTPSWGAMIDQGTQYLFLAPHLSIIPGIAIMLTVLGFNFLGDGLRDRLAPRGR
jgi:peptide/nickel transport system permease protein